LNKIIIVNLRLLSMAYPDGPLGGLVIDGSPQIALLQASVFQIGPGRAYVKVGGEK
jgi:hypothetical protein